MTDDKVTHLRPVDIQPAEYRDPVIFLRTLAEEIEKGQRGDVTTLAVALLTEGAENGSPLATFGGGRNSDLYRVAATFGAAQLYLLNTMQPKESNR
jgi:hypothetical protein